MSRSGAAILARHAGRARLPDRLLAPRSGRQ